MSYGGVYRIWSHVPTVVRVPIAIIATSVPAPDVVAQAAATIKHPSIAPWYREYVNPVKPVNALYLMQVPIKVGVPPAVPPFYEQFHPRDVTAVYHRVKRGPSQTARIPLSEIQPFVPPEPWQATKRAPETAQYWRRWEGRIQRGMRYPQLYGFPIAVDPTEQLVAWRRDVTATHRRDPFPKTAQTSVHTALFGPPAVTPTGASVLSRLQWAPHHREPFRVSQQTNVPISLFGPPAVAPHEGAFLQRPETAPYLRRKLDPRQRAALSLALYTPEAAPEVRVFLQPQLAPHDRRPFRFTQHTVVPIGLYGPPVVAPHEASFLWKLQLAPRDRRPFARKQKAQVPLSLYVAPVEIDPATLFRRQYAPHYRKPFVRTQEISVGLGLFGPPAVAPEEFFVTWRRPDVAPWVLPERTPPQAAQINLDLYAPVIDVFEAAIVAWKRDVVATHWPPPDPRPTDPKLALGLYGPPSVAPEPAIVSRLTRHLAPHLQLLQIRPTRVPFISLPELPAWSPALLRPRPKVQYYRVPFHFTQVPHPLSSPYLPVGVEIVEFFVEIIGEVDYYVEIADVVEWRADVGEVDFYVEH